MGEMASIFKKDIIVYRNGGFSGEHSFIRKKKQDECPIWHKSYLTIEEAAEYSGIGRAKLRQMTDKEDCPFVLWNGTKRLIKRRVLDEYMDRAYSI